jgi:hypothetical protein
MTKWVEVVELNGAFAFKSKFKNWREALEWVEKQGEVTSVGKQREVLEHYNGLIKSVSRRYVVDNKDAFVIIEREKYGTKSNSL